MDSIGGLALCLLVSGCQIPTQADLIGKMREKAAALEEERQLSSACHGRSMQRIKEFRACLKLPFRSAEQRACYEAIQDTSAYTKQLDCREYHEKTAHFRSQYKKAEESCLAIYPSAALSNRELC